MGEPITPAFTTVLPDPNPALKKKVKEKREKNKIQKSHLSRSVETSTTACSPPTPIKQKFGSSTSYHHKNLEQKTNQSVSKAKK